MLFRSRSQKNIVDGDDSIGLIVSSPSRSQLSQRGQEIELRAGDAIAILHSEPATVTYVEGLQFGLAVPRDALAPRVTNVDSLTMRPISRRSAPTSHDLSEVGIEGGRSSCPEAA